MRALGVLVIVIAAILVWVGVSSLWRTSEMSELLAMLSRTDGQALDPRDWEFRWRISASLILALGLVALVAGTGLVRRRRWGLIVWASLVTALVLLQATTQVLEFTKYAFEQTGPVELASTGLVAIVSWVVVWRVRPRGTPAA
jgi:hypothetical protein